MERYKNLGQVFHDFRKNRNTSLKQIADEQVSASLLSRFERGEADISLTKFLHALDNMRVEVNEFIDVASGNIKTDNIALMSQLVPLEYKRDVAGFQRLLAEQQRKFEKNPSVYQYHLNTILLHGFLCKCNDSFSFPKEFMDEVSDYLFCVEEWSYYELILIGNLYLFMDIDLLHRMGQEIIGRCYGKRASKSLIRIVLLNIFETCVQRNELTVAAYYRDILPPLLENETLLYERNIYHFLAGLLHFKSGERTAGLEQMEQSIQIYRWLRCDNLADNYQKDMAKYTT